jgi:hypothetical protein
MVLATEVVGRAAGSDEASTASFLWAAAGVVEDGGDLSVDDQSSAGRLRIQLRWGP